MQSNNGPSRAPVRWGRLAEAERDTAHFPWQRLSGNIAKDKVTVWLFALPPSGDADFAIQRMEMSRRWTAGPTGTTVQRGETQSGETLTRASMRALWPLTIQTQCFAYGNTTWDVVSKSHGANKHTSEIFHKESQIRNNKGVEIRIGKKTTRRWEMEFPFPSIISLKLFVSTYSQVALHLQVSFRSSTLQAPSIYSPSLLSMLHLPRGA